MAVWRHDADFRRAFLEDSASGRRYQNMLFVIEVIEYFKHCAQGKVKPCQKLIDSLFVICYEESAKNKQDDDETGTADAENDE